MKKGICIGLLAALLLTGCSPAASEPPALLEPVGVTPDTVATARGDLVDQAFFSAAVTPESVELSFAADGVLAELNAHLGQEVKKGDVLARLDRTRISEEIERLQEEIADSQSAADYEKRLKQLDIQIAETELAAIEDNYENRLDRKLAAVKVEKLQMELSQITERYQLKEKQLRSKLATQQNALQNDTLTAPVDGRIVWVDENLAVNRSVSADAPAFYLTDESSMTLIGKRIDDSLLLKAEKITAQIEGREYAITPVEYTIAETMEITQSGGVLRGHYTFDAPDEALKSGQYASICLEYSAVSDVLYLPTNAVYRSGKEYYVYLMDGESRTRCVVEIGLQTDAYTEITSGLKEGDQVYVQNA